MVALVWRQTNQHAVTACIHQHWVSVCHTRAWHRAACGLLAAQVPRLVLSPHIYPSSVTGSVDEVAAEIEVITNRWDQSWGWKMQGVDITFQVWVYHIGT